MIIKLKNGKEYELVSLREELLKEALSTYWSLRAEIINVDSGEISSEFVDGNFDQLLIVEDGNRKMISGYTILDSANIVYDPFSLSTNCILRLKKEVI